MTAGMVTFIVVGVMGIVVLTGIHKGFIKP